MDTVGYYLNCGIDMNNAAFNNLLKIDRKQIAEDEGIVYLLEMTIEGDKYVKVGVTTRDIEVRMCELAVSCWKQYRYMPHIYSKRHRKTQHIYEKEAEILKILEEYRAEPDKKVQGHTELHRVDLECAVMVYESVLKDGWKVVTDQGNCKKCGKERIFSSSVGENQDITVYTCGNKCELKDN